MQETWGIRTEKNDNSGSNIAVLRNYKKRTRKHACRRVHSRSLTFVKPIVSE